MPQVTKLLHQGHGLARTLLKRAATVELDWALRQKSRFDCTDSQGRPLEVFLPPGTLVRDGDVLVADDGSVVRVLARPQPVMVVRPGERGSAFDLMRAVYQLGNRHVAVELQPDHLKIEPDQALAAMLRALRLTVTDTFGPFEPEAALAGHGVHEEPPHRHPHVESENELHDRRHEHDSEVHDHEHDSHRHGEHGQSLA